MDEKTLTISELNQQIASSLADAFPGPFWVEGEMQGYNRDALKASTRRWGQVYFEMIQKEEGQDSVKASIKALSWGNAHSAILKKLSHASEKLKLQDGMKVRFLCEVDFYWPRASLQLKIQDIDPNFTLGDMERARQELIEALKKEDLFDQNREAILPRVPQTLGVITSEGSAAYHDFLNELGSEGYGFRLYLVDARMQGEDTESSVVKAIRQLSAKKDIEALVIIRGGGSRSDLIWFDREKIARTIAGCPKPVITGIGHEIDLSVADLVAHESRKTPTAAAQFFLEKMRTFDQEVSVVGQRIMTETRDLMTSQTQALHHSVSHWTRSIDMLVQGHRHNMLRASQRLALDSRRHVSLQLDRLGGFLPRAKTIVQRALSTQQEELKSYRTQITQTTQRLLTTCHEKLTALEKECALKDPQRLLARGYSLLFQKGKVVKSIQDIVVGQEMVSQLADGYIDAVASRKRGEMVVSTKKKPKPKTPSQQQDLF